jgi:hypothetical protein
VRYRIPHGCAYRRVVERWLGPQALASMRVLELPSYQLRRGLRGIGNRRRHRP